ncbi:hypothetical protein [Flavobacterium columnare]|uniref:hypothetical protein n=1 Tax=Flavobacterium columnare TaxID=996 RepID=UPI001781AC8F|nr:hypothetical protein [Flavobacterium columnare]QOG63193.1 hypothetical protein HUE31_10465 [Flavobacterium columnare]QOG68640.1 hypothetical protein HUE33_10460 [Flavobacterium columnare]QOG71363.1 hypothetical protein HUE34_10470 [Flavobacterium columnare]QOG82245.1 hypothetical protein HUE38_10460 [Flavobacterium columnare]
MSNIFILLSFLFISFSCIGQGKLIERLKKDNYSISYYDSFDLLKSRVDTTKANTNKILYSKKHNFIFGVIYNQEDYTLNFFVEDIKANNLYYYTLNPFLDNTLESIKYDMIVSNLYNCYVINFNKNEVIEYNIYLRVNNYALLYSKNDDICSNYNIVLKEKLKTPDFKTLKGITKIKSNTCLKYDKKNFLKNEKTNLLSPQILNYIINFLPPDNYGFSK